MKKLSVVLFALLVLFGCSSPKKETKKTMAMIVPIPQGDPFIKIAFGGVQKLAKDKGFEEAKIIEALDKSEYSEQIRTMAQAGTNPIYVLWDDLAEEAIKISPEFPDTHFIIVDSYATADIDNLKTIVVEPQEASFVAGFVAARTTMTKKIAWIGSMNTPVVDRFKDGFVAGAQYADPSVNVETVYIGDANDPNKGSELAKQIIEKGVDVIMHSANQSGLGVIRAGEEMKVKVIGVDEWQGSINEDIVFWSALKDIGGAVYKAGESSIDGTFKKGLENYDISTGVDLYDQRDFDKLTPELQHEVKEVVENIKSGVIKVSE